MNETLKDFAIGDAYQSDFEQCQAEALEQMYTHARCLTESIEHLIDDEDETLLVDNLDIVFTTILQIKDLAFYSYTAERTDRWGKTYYDEFEYNFKSEIVDHLFIELAYIWNDD